MNLFDGEYLGQLAPPSFDVEQRGTFGVFHNGTVVKVEHSVEHRLELLYHFKTCAAIELHGLMGQRWTIVPGEEIAFLNGEVSYTSKVPDRITPYSRFKSPRLNRMCLDGEFDRELRTGKPCGDCEGFNGYDFGFIAEAKKENPRQLEILQNRRVCGNNRNQACPMVHGQLGLHLRLGRPNQDIDIHHLTHDHYAVQAGPSDSAVLAKQVQQYMQLNAVGLSLPKRELSGWVDEFADWPPVIEPILNPEEVSKLLGDVNTSKSWKDSK